MQSDATNFEAYLAALPEKRRQPIDTVRTLILETVPGAEESMRYGMPTYDVNGSPLAALASQKQYMSLYVDVDELAAHKAAFSHLNCGKSCIRFRKLDDLPLAEVQDILINSAQKLA